MEPKKLKHLVVSAKVVDRIQKIAREFREHGGPFAEKILLEWLKNNARGGRKNG
jgi:hypothetical protein